MLHLAETYDAVQKTGGSVKTQGDQLIGDEVLLFHKKNAVKITAKLAATKFGYSIGQRAVNQPYGSNQYVTLQRKALILHIVTFILGQGAAFKCEYIDMNVTAPLDTISYPSGKSLANMRMFKAHILRNNASNIPVLRYHLYA
jgi:mannose/fructose/N-acetylgalactosamine-specific phosphotransferase system component IID